MKKTVLYIFFLGITTNLFAQGYSRAGDWKKYRNEVFVSMGTSQFLGDLGGRDRTGTHYSPADINFSQTRTAFGAGFRYRVQKWFNVTGTFNYLIVKGDDAETQDPYRNNRNLNFKSNIFELMGRVEFGYSSARSGNRYSIKKTLSSRVHKRNWNLFGYTGLGAFYYNPKGREPNGQFVALRPLHTEGQGLPGGPKQYTNYSMCIPFGIYYKVTWDKVWSVGVDICWRKTFTDYIDDVGTSYYDPVALQAAYGKLSAVMADPSKGAIAGATKPDGNGIPAQRGNIQKDSYVSFQVTVGYTIKKQKRKKARLRSKF
jgi:hypothetical protein